VSAMVLPQNLFGRTGLSVTRLGYGAMEVRGPLHGRAPRREH
jgi:aryl-alcohol dehydrogenase-like predicted oxidoreductase